MDQEEVSRKIWKNKDILSTCGYGIIILIVWDFIKQILYSFYITPDTEAISTETYTLSTLIFEAALLIICIVTGILAGKYGKSSKKEKPLIVVFSIILAVFSIAAVVADALALGYLFKEVKVISILSVITDFLF